MSKWLTWLEQKYNAANPNQPKSRSMRWLIIIFLGGVGFMLLHSFVTVKDVNTLDNFSAPSPPPLQSTFEQTSITEDKQKFQSYERAYQEELKNILQKVIGADDVDVLVTIESTEEMIVEKNVQDTHKTTQEQDNKQVSRQISERISNGQVVVYQQSGLQQPLIVKIIKPKIRGVIVIARGAEQLVIKKMIVEAVERGLDVAPHRICVLPRKHQ